MSTSFAELGLNEQILSGVESLGFETPTPVQAQAIPLVLEGRDVVASAQTGTGKTAAFALPALQLIAGVKGKGPHALVVTPTRELAAQIDGVCKVVCERTGQRVVIVMGGAKFDPQIAELDRGCDMLVATPGRLIDLMEHNHVELSGVQTLVLDEADRMLDMGFLPSVRKIVAQVPRERQTLLLSATLDDSAIAGISDLVHDPVRVEIARKGTVAETIDQFALPVSLEAKNALLAKVLVSEGPHRVIVFTRTKHGANKVAQHLARAGIIAFPEFTNLHGIYCWCLYYLYIQKFDERLHTFEDFRRAVDAILKYSQQGQYTPYTLAVWRMVEVLKTKPPSMANMAGDYLRRLDPDL